MSNPTSTSAPVWFLGITEEQQALRDWVRSFVGREVTEEVVREAIDAKREGLPPFWPALAEQGLLALHLPESVGGAGAALVDTAVVVEELGRVLAPGPFLPTVVVSAVLAAAAYDPAVLAGLADGSTPAALALAPGTLAGTREPDGSLTVRGRSAPALGGHVAGLFLLPVRLPEGEVVWVLLDSADVEVDDDPGDRQYSHDLTRRLATVRVDGFVRADRVLDRLDPRRPLDLAAVLFAAEAAGLAGWATATAADYAKVREQFGRPIGQFQGVKHRSAWMLAAAERARVCAWDAARAARQAAELDEEASLAAAIAAVVSVDAGFSTARDCINTLGGIGYTWEHDAGHYLRRAQTLRILLGPAAGWAQRVADLTLAGVRRCESVDLGPAAEQIRTQIRAELAPAAGMSAQQQAGYLAERGYTAPHLPRPWGRDADAVTQLVIAEELVAAGLRPYDMVIGNWVVPTLIAHGSEEQLARFVPPSLRGDIVWCQLFSEPGAGSDLAGLRTRAERVDGGWKINGQKVWTSMARQADYGILLARTDPGAERHDGLSYFLLDMSAPGIDARPLRELTGDALFNEVFLDDVFVPDDLLVGRPGEGWKLARTTLMSERVSLSNESVLGDGAQELVRIAAADPHAMDPERRTVLGRVVCDAHALELLGLRGVIRSVNGGRPGAESSIAKLVGVAHIQQVWEIAMEWLGPESIHGEPQPLDATWSFLTSRNLSIAGGTTDIQLNIIGERLLGLPRDPAPVTDRKAG